MPRPASAEVDNDVDASITALAVIYESDIAETRDNLHRIVDDALYLLKDRGDVNENCGWCTQLRRNLIEVFFPQKVAAEMDGH